ncbi:unnamed protein product [Brachionus calyciflorus]|uniref:ZZ-type domain-containing protein n=1 Tax=Brachionus calyciflorus TaxID=104777 RepID=A0A813ST91_9BILA|nr:unnamed protein product [Brachionus calyciflorus]
MCDLMTQSKNSFVQNNNGNQSNSNSICLNPKLSKLLTDYKQIILELRAQNFDVIRFATYRTASKLRFIQKKLNLHLIDLWNVIETFRDNNLHTLDLLHELDSSKLEQCIQNMYLQLNKRLALNQHINVETQTQLLLSWLLNLYDKNRLSKIKVFSFKIALTTMCSGKLVDKLKYIFNQICEQSKNTLLIQKFDNYLKDLLILPKSVFEEPSFGYNENTTKTCFDWNIPIFLEDFLSVALSDAGPPCFIWLNIFHRFTIVQNVQHSVKCGACERTNFNGFRYKCQKCRKYQLCQDCFWRGRISHSHQLSHQMKEYTSYKSAAKQLSSSLKRSFFCKPNKNPSSQPTQKSNHTLNFPKTSHNVQFITSNSNYQYNTLANTSNVMNNSDYNLLHKKSSFKDKMFQSLSLESSKLQNGIPNTQTLPNTTSLPINNHNDIYSTSNPQFKNQISMTTSNIFSNDSYYDPKLNQSIEFKNLINDLSSKTTQSINQFNQTNTLNRQYNNNLNNYSNTLSMLRNRNNENQPYASTNLFGVNFLPKTTTISNTILSSSISNGVNLDEHHIIQTYSARLADIYSKNPQLLQSPATSNTPSPRSNFSNNYATLSKNTFPKSTSVKSIKTNTLIKPKLSQITESNSRTSSLSRPSPVYSSSQRYSKNYNQTTSRSLSETNFRQSNRDLDGDSEDTDFDAENVLNNQLLKEKREIVAKLEKQNKEILKEIKRLKLKQLSNCSLDLTDQVLEPKYQAPMSATLNRKVYNQDPLLLELQTLKHKKGQLESRMQILESNKNELLNRLNQLDALITKPISASAAMQMPQSVNNKNRNGIITNLQQQQQPRSWSTPSTPAMYEIHPPKSKVINAATSLNQSTNSSIVSLNDHNSALHNDLLLAADSVTSAMQNLVKELNSENDDLEFYSGKQNTNSIRLNQNKISPGYSSLSASNTPLNYRKILRKNSSMEEEELVDHLSTNNESLFYQNYLIAESFIDDLPEDKKENKQEKESIKQPTVDELLSSLVDNTELGESWRKELEQILIEDSKSKENENKMEKKDDSNEFKDLL